MKKLYKKLKKLRRYNSSIWKVLFPLHCTYGAENILMAILDDLSEIACECFWKPCIDPRDPHNKVPGGHYYMYLQEHFAEITLSRGEITLTYGDTVHYYALKIIYQSKIIFEHEIVLDEGFTFHPWENPLTMPAILRRVKLLYYLVHQEFSPIK